MFFFYGGCEGTNQGALKAIIKHRLYTRFLERAMALDKTMVYYKWLSSQIVFNISAEGAILDTACNGRFQNTDASKYFVNE